MTALDHPTALEKVKEAAMAGNLSPSSAENISRWLTEERYTEYAPKVVELIAAQRWEELDDAFWQVIPFGTGGRRGRMFPVGTNAINERTIGESAQGVADYVKRHKPQGSWACAIAYDTRHRSREFAELCAGVMAAAGFTVYFLDGHRSTPALSFAVRLKQCDCGIMVTASHNPPSDNAVKVYWSTGGQVLPPHDRRMIDCVMQVQDVRKTRFTEAREAGQVVFCQDEVDAAYRDAMAGQSRPGPRDLKIIYSPLHGVGATSVLPALEAAGFSDVELFGPHADPDPDFPNVPDHIANPENPAVFETIVQRARETGAELVLATDPDCDRVGCAAPLELGPHAAWDVLTGNQIGALLTDYLLESMQREGRITPSHYVVETIVTSKLVQRIADSYGVRAIDDLMVGFKWIGGVMEYEGAEKFVIGTEESYGFLVGDHARDKDAGVASMLLAELAALAKSQGETLHQRLDRLFTRHGVHAERTVSVMMPGAQGKQQMEAVMERFRNQPPAEMGGLKVTQARDLNQPVAEHEDDLQWAMDAARKGDLVILETEAPGNYVAVRPSGTEPKIKFYMFAYQPPETLDGVSAARGVMADRLKAMESDLRAFALQ